MGQTAAAAPLRDGSFHRARALCWAAAVALLVGMAALVAPLPQWSDSAVSWETLLAPYAAGTPLPEGFRIDLIRRGDVNDVVVSVVRPDGSGAAEVHVLPRGCWSGIRESQSFGIGYETPRSPAPERDAIVEALAEAIRSRDRGLPPPDMIPIDGSFDARTVQTRLQGLSSVFFGGSGVVLALLIWLRRPTFAVVALVLGAADLLVAAFGRPAPAATCPTGFDLIDSGVRVLQLGWALLILSAPVLCWRAGRRACIGGERLLIAVSVVGLLALAAIWTRGDEPLHANGHAWREAREVLQPWGERGTRAAPFVHGRGAIALQWALASAEHAVSGTANPFRISRLASAAAAGSTAFLTAMLARSAWAGLAAGCVLALMPLARTLAVSGSALAVSAWLLPWSLGLLIAAGLFRDRLLLAGGALAGALGVLSHTAMLAWAPALAIAWLIVARPGFRWSRWAFIALTVVALAWLAEFANAHEMLSERNQGAGLLVSARLGFQHRNLLLDPRWVSPVLLPLAGLGVLGGLRRGRAAPVLATLLAMCVGAVPFFTVIACSSDAVRYQAPLLGLVTSLAVAALWEIPGLPRLGRVGGTLLAVPILASLALLPLPSRQQPLDPTAIEHRLAEEAAGRMEPGTLVVLPSVPFARQEIIVDFPDFLLPARSWVAFADDPRIAAYRGPRLLYLGLACVSWADGDGAADRSDLRPECRALRAGAQPWLVRALRPEDLPSIPDGGTTWTFHQLATGVPFGFFAPE
jgi:hypothetical protein